MEKNASIRSHSPGKSPVIIVLMIVFGCKTECKYERVDTIYETVKQAYLDPEELDVYISNNRAAILDDNFLYCSEVHRLLIEQLLNLGLETCDLFFNTNTLDLSECKTDVVQRYAFNLSLLQDIIAAVRLEKSFINSNSADVMVLIRDNDPNLYRELQELSRQVYEDLENDGHFCVTERCRKKFFLF